jgi:hypothetical protein
MFKDNILSELSNLKQLCEKFLVEKRQRSKLERHNVHIDVCALSKLHFLKSQLHRCAHHIPVRYESILIISAVTSS